MVKAQKIGVMALSLIFPMLSGCLIIGDRVCVQRCELNEANGEYVYKNPCGYLDISVPRQFVTSCTQCSKDEFYLAGNGMSLALNYPSFSPVDNHSAKKHNAEEHISIHFNSVDCQWINRFNTVEANSRRTKEILNSHFATPPDGAARSVRLIEDLYLIKNNYDPSYGEDVYYWKAPDGYYDFLIRCNKRSCSSASEPIFGTPYGYSYRFPRPPEAQDLLKIHRAVKNHVNDIYPVSQAKMSK